MLSVLAVAGLAAAQDATRPAAAPSWQVPPQRPPSTTVSRAPTITVDPAACRWVQRHEPAADVEYRPGVDVNGQPVAPADLPGSPAVRLPERLEIGITADLADRFGIPRSALYGAEAYVGTVTVEGNRVLFNGQPITSLAEQELVVLCGKQRQR
ncbi:hypothetical protein HHL28_06355 [Aerophototrophica crusticola]|uniref:Uncharacterized protein n=1 Tax=Aerophototrophica crusticola TaxID=1709002 RepID=A0A858R5U0_9PROT|nr:hypothetical protein HHL28_06355 [Rhodospirillaceae bacterium B3]